MAERTARGGRGGRVRWPSVRWEAGGTGHAGGRAAEAAEILHVTFAIAGGGEAQGDRTVQKYLNIDYS